MSTSDHETLPQRAQVRVDTADARPGDVGAGNARSADARSADARSADARSADARAGNAVGAGGRAGPVDGRHWFGPADILALQRGAGNGAVAKVMASRRARSGAAVARDMQRFVGSEHKELGDSTGRSVDLGNGVVLSWGDVVALAGDQYATLDDLLADTRDDAGKQRLRAAIEKDGIASGATAGLPAPTGAQGSARDLTFIKLAADNAAHFDADGAAMARWQDDHGRALNDALDAGLEGNATKKQLADAREAFAQHFLTDSFSGGHIRVPRADILGWYRTNFAPAVVDGFVRTMRERVIDAVTAQIHPQTNWPDVVVRYKVSTAVDQRLATAIATLGGHAQLVEYFALAVAGAVSGALHDLEGSRGVMVTSEDHPEPWRAFGDDDLAKSPVSRAQAEAAVAAATAQIDAAYAIGAQYHHGADPASTPTVSYFGFDSADLNPAAAAEADAAAAYLHLHPEAQVTLVGNTDPAGSDAYNLDLGLRRANAVAARLLAGGATQEQVIVRSDGKNNLVSAERGGYRLDRRVTYGFASRPGPYLDPVHQEAAGKVQTTIGPPFPTVTRFVPHPVPTPVASPATQGTTDPNTQVELEEWRWGSIPPTLRGEIDGWVKGKVGPATAALTSSPDLAAMTVEGYAVQPLPVVQAMLDALMADPSGYLERAFGRPMSP